VEDALQSRRAEILEIPITPSRVWQALRQGEAQPKASRADR